MMDEQTPDTWTARQDFQGWIDLSRSTRLGWAVYRNNVMVALVSTEIGHEADEAASARLFAHASETARQRDELLAIAKNVETWWLEIGRKNFFGAPACLFALREVITDVETSNKRKTMDNNGHYVARVQITRGPRQLNSFLRAMDLGIHGTGTSLVMEIEYAPGEDVTPERVDRAIQAIYEQADVRKEDFEILSHRVLSVVFVEDTP